jgi:hypothetical protein
MDPVIGRTVRPSTFNRYLYASADPLDRTDPSGEVDALFYAQLAETARLRARAALKPRNDAAYIAIGVSGGTAAATGVFAGLEGASQMSYIARAVGACATLATAAGRFMDWRTGMESGGIYGLFLYVACSFAAAEYIHDEYY